MSQVRTGRTLGILGAGRGCGVTHLAVWMANYLAGAKRKRTAVLEWNDHGDIGRLLYFCKGAGDGKGNMADAKEPPASGRVWEVDYFPKAGPRQLADCLDRDYARVLVDYGEFTGESLLECTRCDQKIIVG